MVEQLHMPVPATIVPYVDHKERPYIGPVALLGADLFLAVHTVAVQSGVLPRPAGGLDLGLAIGC